MSYDIYLKDLEGEVCELTEKHQMKGGTYVLGGTAEAKFNVTYNYAGILYNVLDGGIRSLYGKTGEESVPLLKAAISKLKDDCSEDYWEATEGNVKKALSSLLTLAEAVPSGIWDGD